MTFRRILIIAILFAVVMVLGCDVQSRYKTRTFLTSEQNREINKLYEPPEEQAEIEPFLEEYGDAPAIRVNGREIKASDIQRLYEWMWHGKEVPVNVKRDACMQWIQSYAVMTQWPETIDVALSRLEEIRQSVFDGVDFSNLVVENSHETNASQSAGDLGTVHRGMMVPIFEMHAFNDPLNRPSEPFPTVFGWHIAMPLERNTDDPNDPTVHVQHLLLAHGLDPSNIDQIAKDYTGTVQRWT
ncbi:MAG TPA: hypothetical protein ENN67_05060, partial [Firmicutes bacterium]|nr:hypothetical protein [Bacillota bacterium]